MQDITFAAVMLYLQGITALEWMEWVAVVLLAVGIHWYPDKPRAAPIVSFFGCIIFGYISFTVELWGMTFVNTGLCGFHINNLIRAIRAGRASVR